MDNTITTRRKTKDDIIEEQKDKIEKLEQEIKFCHNVIGELKIKVSDLEDKAENSADLNISLTRRNTELIDALLVLIRKGVQYDS